MTSECSISRPLRKADSERRSWLLALLATILTLALLWYGFRTRPPEIPEEKASAKSSCHFVGNWQNHRQLANWEKMLHVWARLADPTLMVLPDEELGFSSVRQAKRVLPESPIPGYQFQIVLSPEGAFPDIRLTSPPRSLPDEARLRWVAAKPEMPPTPELTPLPEGIVWRRPDGSMLDSMPELDLAFVRKAIAESGRPRYPTRLEVFAGDAESPTRVRVRRASGNTQLDLHVVAAIRRDVGTYERHRRFLADALAPTYYPSPGTSAFLEIEWSLLPAELSPEE